MTRILVVDDHELMRRQLRQMIGQKNQWQICGEAANGEEAVQKYSALKPNVLVMDFNMPTLDGLQAARQILRDYPTACILILSISDSGAMVEEVKKAGIKGFCSKSSMEVFVDAVEAVSRGETFFTEKPI